MTKPQFTVTSFGYGHGPAPAEANMIQNVSDWFRDPHIDPVLRELTGKHPDVASKVRNTPHVLGYITGLFHSVTAVLKGGGHVHLAVGCVGGRHRSVVIADTIAEWIADEDWTVEVVHRDVDKDVIRR